MSNTSFSPEYIDKLRAERLTAHEMQVLRNASFALEELLCNMQSIKHLRQASLAFAQLYSLVSKRDGAPRTVSEPEDDPLDVLNNLEEWLRS